MTKRFSLDLHFNNRILVLTVLSTTLLMVDHYFTLTPIKELDRVILYLLIPLGAILLGFRQSPRDYGFQIGDWRAGLLITLASLITLTPILWLVVKYSPQMQSYYQTTLDFRLPLLTFLDLIGWEFIFRGFLLFGYYQAFGDDALWLQAVPFALAHLGKPSLETFTTLFGGFLFGLIAKRTRSFFYPFIIHFFIAFLVSLFSILQAFM